MKKATAIILFTVSAFISSANSTIDSLLAQLSKRQKKADRALTLSNLAIAYASIDPEKALDYANQGLGYSDKINSTGGKAAANAALGITLYKNGKYNEAIDFLDRALGLYRGINDVIGQGFVVSSLADSYNASGRYQQAIDGYFLSLHFREAQRDTNGIGIAYQNLAGVYFKLDQKREGAEQLRKALEILKPSTLKLELAHCYYNIAILKFSGHYECDSSIYFIRNAVDILEIIGEEQRELEYKNLLAEKLYECSSKTEGRKMAETVLARSIAKNYQ